MRASLMHFAVALAVAPAVLAIGATNFGCRDPFPPSPDPKPSTTLQEIAPAASTVSAIASSEPLPSASSVTSGDAGASASASASADAASPCPDGMAFVEGEYCPLVEQVCVEHKGDADKNSEQAICLRYQQPSTCVAPKRVHMRYCMDRYEYPGKAGELPRTLVSFTEAAQLCGAQGKRLCSESEFNFACEGEEMRPYATGFDRDAAKCNFDKPFRSRPASEMKSYAECMANSRCKAEFERVDQRVPIGSNAQCVSPFGVFDMNGNANEWTSLRYKPKPHRSAVKGGWWGPVRNRCRPIVTSHDENYAGYEVGFRCCTRPER